jgi:hypothetical protein
MHEVSTKTLADALQAAFDRCEAAGCPLKTTQKTELVAAMFDWFADTVIRERSLMWRVYQSVADPDEEEE